jgi:hypothetical protein
MKFSLIWTGAKMLNITGYPTSELCRITGLSPQRIAQVAKQRKWTPVKVGRANVYQEYDVTIWLDAHRRTQLLVKAGWWPQSGRLGLNEDDGLDTECEKCSGFAVLKPRDGEQIYCEKCGLSAA